MQTSKNSLENLRIIKRVLFRFRFRNILYAGLGQCSWIVALHLIFLGFVAFFAVKQPLSLTVPTVIIFSYSVYLMMPLVFLLTLFLPRFRLTHLARRLDRENPKLCDAFQTSLSLNNHSRRTVEKLDKWYSRLLVGWKGPAAVQLPLPPIIGFCSALAFWVVMGVVSPDMRAFVKASFLPLRFKAQIPKLVIDLKVDKPVVGVGDTALFSGTISGRVSGQPLFAYLKENGTVDRRFPLEFAGDRADFSIGPLSRSVSVYFAGENGRSQTVLVNVVPRPFLTGIQVVVEPPSYTGLPRDTLTGGMTSFSILPGSRVVWRLTSQRLLNKLVWQGVFPGIGVKPDSLYKDTLGPGKTFTVNKTFIRLPYAYSLFLEDETGVQNSHPMVSQIEPRLDKLPEVVILRPEEDEYIPKDGRMPISALVKDDFGVSQLKISWRVSSSGFLKDTSVSDVSNWLKSRRLGYFDVIWDMTTLDLRPDNVVSFSLIACDNNPVPGGRCTESRTRRVLYPSIREIISEIERKQQLALSNLKSATERQKKVAAQTRRGKRHSREKQVPLSEFERKRILIRDPKILHRDARNVLESIRKKLNRLRLASNKKQLKRALKESERALNRARSATPSESILQKDIFTQLRALKTLHQSHLHLEKKLSIAAGRLDEETMNPDKAAWKNLQKNLENQLKNQRELKSFLRAKAEEQKLTRELNKRTQQEQLEAVQDIDKAVKDLEKLVSESMEKNLFTSDLLKKMEKVQDLLAEVLPDSLAEMLRKKMEGEEVDAEALRESVKNLMTQAGLLEEQLNRAIDMLEHLRDMRRLEEWRQRTEELVQKEKALEKNIAGDKALKTAIQSNGLEKRQEKIRRVTENLAAEIRAKSQQTRGWEKLSPLAGEKTALENMKQTEQHLRHPDADEQWNLAVKSTARARQGLQAMANALSRFALSLESKNFSLNAGEIEDLVNESLRLSQVQLAMQRDENGRRKLGWHSSLPVIYSNLAQVARWLMGKIREMGARNSLVSTHLMVQSAILFQTLKSASLEMTPENKSAALRANHLVTRELLKLLNLAHSLPAGQGKGQSGGRQDQERRGNEGTGNLANQLQGLSGRQLAVNRATSQLLRAMLEGRRKGETGESPQGIANSQGRLGEQLETLAESSEGGPGSASAKLRKLAEEARALEHFLRREKLSPKLKARQERFQARLLETAKSVKERGFSEKRDGLRSGAVQGAAPASAGVPYSERLRVLETEKQRAARLNLNSVQRRAVESFYEELIIR